MTDFRHEFFFFGNNMKYFDFIDGKHFVRDKARERRY